MYQALPAAWEEACCYVNGLSFIKLLIKSVLLVVALCSRRIFEQQATACYAKYSSSLYGKVWSMLLTFTFAYNMRCLLFVCLLLLLPTVGSILTQ